MFSCSGSLPYTAGSSHCYHPELTKQYFITSNVFLQRFALISTRVTRGSVTTYGMTDEAAVLFRSCYLLRCYSSPWQESLVSATIHVFLLPFSLSLFSSPFLPLLPQPPQSSGIIRCGAYPVFACSPLGAPRSNTLSLATHAYYTNESHQYSS